VTDDAMTGGLMNLRCLLTDAVEKTEQLLERSYVAPPLPPRPRSPHISRPLLFVIVTLSAFATGSIYLRPHSETSVTAFSRANAAMRGKDYARATVEYRKAADDEKADAEICLTKIAECSLYLGRYPEALAAVDEMEVKGIRAAASYWRYAVMEKQGVGGAKFYLDYAALHDYPPAAAELARRKTR
jgi:tetratricopeptide (TPR) repeat protein